MEIDLEITGGKSAPPQFPDPLNIWRPSFGTVVFPDRAPFHGRVGFPVPQGPPVSTGAASSVGWAPISAECSAAGFFTTEIVAGRYWVHVGNSLRRLITVADDSKSLPPAGPLGGLRRDRPQNFRFVTEDSIHSRRDGTISFPRDRWGARRSRVGGLFGWRRLDAWIPKVVGTTAFFRAVEDGSWHAPYLTGPADAPVMAFAPADEQVPGGNFNLSATRWQLRNIDSGLYHTLHYWRSWG